VQRKWWTLLAVSMATFIDAAIELASRIPQVSRGGAVEVRPVMES
jgi:hypothetical protein